MTKVERMKIFKKAWKEAILTSIYPEHPEGMPVGTAYFLLSVSKQLFPENNLVSQLNAQNLEKYVGDQRAMKHDMINLIGQDIHNFTDANDIKEIEAGTQAIFTQGQNSRLLKKTGIRLNSCIHLGNGYFMDNSTGSSYTWDEYAHDNEFEPRLLYGAKFNYNPTVHVDGVYVRPNNIGDNNDEVVWRDFWDSICL